MSNERVKLYLDHLTEYAELTDDEKELYLDGPGGDLLDNLWYAMSDDERKVASETVCKEQCKKYGHMETAADETEWCCPCGSKKPLNIK